MFHNTHHTIPQSQPCPDLFYGFYGSHNGTRAINLGSVGDSELVCNVIDPATKEKMIDPALVSIHVRAVERRSFVIWRVGQGGVG
jgi:hypothetical protein